nr:hypothetical protein [Isosphaera pallida]
MSKLSWSIDRPYANPCVYYCLGLSELFGRVETQDRGLLRVLQLRQ